MNRKKAVRLSDVAKVAGVSMATASKSLNNSTEVSAETRERVREVARRLDFRPNALALSFASGRSQIVGVLTHRATSTFSRPVVMGAILELGGHERAALVFDGDRLAGQKMTESIETLRARRIDGLLVVGAGLGWRTPSISHHFDVPVTYAFTASDDPADPVFLPDNEQAGYLATRHLIERGRERIVHVTGDRENLAVQRRHAGMRRAVEEAGLPALPVVYGGWRQEWGEEATASLLDRGKEFDAIFCGNDHIGFGALDVLEARGRRVPDDVAIVGVDNWEGVILDQNLRRLTTVDLNLMGLGRLAARSVVESERASGEHYNAPSLVEGPST